MLLQRFDQGWGSELPVKQFELRIIRQYLQYVIGDQNTKIATVNSTWYTDQYHDQVISKLVPDLDAIVLISLLDPPIVSAHKFHEIGIPCVEIGYYNSPYFVDFWALMVNDFFDDHDFFAAKPQYAFMCLNRKPHSHRRYLVKALHKRNLLHQGLVSLGHNWEIPNHFLNDDILAQSTAPNADTDTIGIVNDIASLGNLKHWNNHLLNIVTETVWDVETEHFVSEKIYKPIWGMRPFLVFAPNGARQWLEQRGFETYINDWQDISDLDLSKPDNIPDFLSCLCQQSSDYLAHKLLALYPKILHNKQNFFRYVEINRNKINQGIKWPI